MDPSTWDRIQRLFHDALELPEDRRRDFVRQACTDAPEIESQVLALLVEDRSDDSLLDQGLANVADAVLDGSESAPRQIGPYRVLRLLGEGGMGVVYLAHREDLDSLAAIKLLRDAKLAPHRRERFLQEERFLASLSHPSIARLYDAGTLADGTPYFVMEYVRRHPVDGVLRAARAVTGAASEPVPAGLRGGPVRPSAGADSSRPQAVEHPRAPRSR